MVGTENHVHRSWRFSGGCFQRNRASLIRRRVHARGSCAVRRTRGALAAQGTGNRGAPNRGGERCGGRGARSHEIQTDETRSGGERPEGRAQEEVLVGAEGVLI